MGIDVKRQHDLSFDLSEARSICIDECVKVYDTLYYFAHYKSSMLASCLHFLVEKLATYCID